MPLSWVRKKFSFPMEIGGFESLLECGHIDY